MNAQKNKILIAMVALALLSNLMVGCTSSTPTAAPASAEQSATTAPTAAVEQSAATAAPAASDATSAAVPSQKATAAKTGEIKIGVIYPTTGSLAYLGDEIKQLVDFAQKEVNDNGGINGQQVKITVEDDQGTSAGAVTAAQKLITVDNVNALVGPLFTSSIIAVKPIAEQAKIPVMIATSADSRIFADNGYIFSLDVGNDVSVKLLSNYLYTTKGFKKLALLGVYNDQTLNMVDLFKQNWAALGGTIVSSTTFNAGTDDFRTNLTQIKQQKPDVIWVKSDTQEIETIIRQMTELGMKDVFIASDYEAIQSDFFTAVGTNIDGRLAYTQNGIATDPDTKAKYAAFSKAYSQAYAKDPDAVTDLLYDDFGLLFQAMKNGATSGDELRAALASISKFTGVTGFITLDASGRSSGSSTVIEYKDGQTSVATSN